MTPTAPAPAWLTGLDHLCTLVETGEFERALDVSSLHEESVSINVRETTSEVHTSIAAVLDEPFFRFFRDERARCIGEITNALRNGDGALWDALEHVRSLTDHVVRNAVPADAKHLQAAAITEVSAELTKVAQPYVHRRALEQAADDQRHRTTLQKFWDIAWDRIADFARGLKSLLHAAANRFGCWDVIHPAAQQTYTCGYHRESVEPIDDRHAHMIIEAQSGLRFLVREAFIALQTYNHIDEATGVQSIRARRAPYPFPQDGFLCGGERYLFRMPLPADDVRTARGEIFLPRPMRHRERVNSRFAMGFVVHDCWIEVEGQKVLTRGEITAQQLLDIDELGNLILSIPPEILKNAKQLHICCQYQEQRSTGLTAVEDCIPEHAPLITAPANDGLPTFIPADLHARVCALREEFSSGKCTPKDLLVQVATLLGNEWLTYSRCDVRPSPDDPPSLTHGDCVLRRRVASCEGAAAAAARLLQIILRGQERSGYAFVGGFAVPEISGTDGRRIVITGKQAHALLACRVQKGDATEQFLVDATPWNSNQHRAANRRDERRLRWIDQCHRDRDSLPEKHPAFFSPEQREAVSRELQSLEERIRKLWQADQIDAFPNWCFMANGLSTWAPGLKLSPVTSCDLIAGRDEEDDRCAPHLTDYLANHYGEQWCIEDTIERTADDIIVPLTDSAFEGRFTVDAPQVPRDVNRSLTLRDCTASCTFVDDFWWWQLRSLRRVLREAFAAGCEATVQNIREADQVVRQFEIFQTAFHGTLLNLLRQKILIDDAQFEYIRCGAPWMTLLPFPPIDSMLIRRSDARCPGTLTKMEDYDVRLRQWTQDVGRALVAINLALDNLPRCSIDATVIPWAAMDLLKSAVQEIPTFEKGEDMIDISPETIYAHLLNAVTADEVEPYIQRQHLK